MGVVGGCVCGVAGVVGGLDSAWVMYFSRSSGVWGCDAGGDVSVWGPSVSG